MSVVRVQRGYKYRLYPNKYQEQLLIRTFGCCRYVYNYGLERKEKSYKEVGRSVSHGELMKELTAIKKEPDKGWLNEVSAGALQESLRILKNSYERFFKKQSGKPHFKSKSKKQSIRYDRTRCKVTERGIKLQKIDKVYNPHKKPGQKFGQGPLSSTICSSAVSTSLAPKYPNAYRWGLVRFSMLPLINAAGVGKRGSCPVCSKSRK